MDSWSPSERLKFGQRLRDARRARNMTQSDVAAMFDLHKAAVSAWEVGTNIPSAEQLARMAVEFGLSCDWLLLGKQVFAFSPELMARLLQKDAETIRQIENGLRAPLDMPLIAKPLPGKEVRWA